ncbi:MAG: PPC domain-containing protein [Myxococcota bacterium]|nr:PPC domain-containing protein [Myxococcota bacterium]
MGLVSEAQVLSDQVDANPIGLSLTGDLQPELVAALPVTDLRGQGVEITVEGEDLPVLRLLEELEVPIPGEHQTTLNHLLQPVRAAHLTPPQRFLRPSTSPAGIQPEPYDKRATVLTTLSRRLLPWALILSLCAGCTGDNLPPSLALVTDQVVFVGESLVIDLQGTDLDGDTLTWTVNGLTSSAKIHPVGPQTGRLVWSPNLSDADPEGRVYAVQVSASDGRGGSTGTAFHVTAYPSYGVPAFDLPTGVVLNLAKKDDLKQLVVVKDDDSTDVVLNLLSGPEGAKLVTTGPKSAYLYWQPVEEQRDTPVHSMVLTATDGIHPLVTHTLLVALVNAGGDAGCTGQPPQVTHEPPADHIPEAGGLVLTAQGEDADSLIGSIHVIWQRDENAQEETTPMKPLDAEQTSWSVQLPTGALGANGTLVRYHLEISDNDDPTGGTCDHQVRSPKVGKHLVGIYPEGTPDSTCVDDSAEPDDSLGQAAPAAPGQTVQGRLCGSLPDVLSIDPSLGGSLSAYLNWNPDHGSLNLRLLSSTGQVLGQASGATGSLQVQGQSLSSGPMYVEVSTAGGPARLSYTLEIHTESDVCPQDSLEPNEDTVTASTLGVGVTSDLLICPADQDWHRLDIGAFQRVDVSLAFDHGYGDLDLQLLNATGTDLLASSESLNSPEVLSYEAWAAQTAYVRVFGFLGASNSYTLQVTSTQMDTTCPPDILESHTTPEAAAVLFSDFYPKLTVCSEEPDWYALDLNGGETVDILVEPQPGSACDLTMYLDPTGAPVQTGAQGAGLVSASWVMAQAGRLWYQVTAGGTAGYDLLQSVIDPDGPCQPDRFEPNETVQTATLLEPGVHTSLRLCGQQDKDVFQVELGVFETLTVTTGHGPDTGFGDVSILGPDGVTNLAFEMDFGFGLTVSALAESAGIYTVMITPYGVTDGQSYDLALLVEGGG